MASREKLYSLRLTASEIRLVCTEFGNACDNGADDQDFPKVAAKARKIVGAIAFAEHQAKGSTTRGVKGDGDAPAA